MHEQDIEEILSYGYWPTVDVDNKMFVAKLYKLNKKSKVWRRVRTRQCKTPLEAWDYLRDTLTTTLKFMI